MCGPCQRWLPVGVQSIAAKTAELPDLIAPAEPELDERQYWAWFPRRRDPDTGQLLPPRGEWRRADPLSVIGGAGLVAGKKGRSRVSGSREAPVPLSLDVVDLLGPALRPSGLPAGKVQDSKRPMLGAPEPVEVQVRSLHLQPVRDMHGWIVGERLVERLRTSVVEQRLPVLDSDGSAVLVDAGDQVGFLPVAAVLDQQVQAWMQAGAPGSERPRQKVEALTDWLVARLPWAYQCYESIGEFAAVVRRLRGTLMSLLGEIDPQPELCHGVECNRCDKRMLFRRNDGTGDVECANPACMKVFRAGEYEEWVRHLAGFERSRRSPSEMRALLRRRAGAGQTER